MRGWVQRLSMRTSRHTAAGSAPWPSSNTWAGIGAHGMLDRMGGFLSLALPAEAAGMHGGNSCWLFACTFRQLSSSMPFKRCRNALGDNSNGHVAYKRPACVAIAAHLDGHLSHGHSCKVADAGGSLPKDHKLSILVSDKLQVGSSRDLNAVQRSCAEQGTSESEMARTAEQRPQAGRMAPAAGTPLLNSSIPAPCHSPVRKPMCVEYGANKVQTSSPYSPEDLQQGW